MTGVEIIAAERARQVAVEGYDAAHDDGHDGGGLALAAVCYASPCRLYVVENDGDEEIRFIDPWPFDEFDDYRKKVPLLRGGLGLTEEALRIRLLAKAGALIAAEIDRIERSMVLQGRV